MPDLEHPADDVVEEEAIVRDDDDGALVLLERLLEPTHGLDVQVVGGLVEQQQIRVLEQRAAQRDAAALATGTRVDHLVAGGQVQLGHRRLDVTIDLPCVLGLDLVLESLELRHDLVHLLVGEVLAELHAQVLVLLQQRADRRDGDLDVLTDGLRLVELGLLGDVAHRPAFGQTRDAVVLLVDARHDAKHRRLAGAVLSDHADLGSLQEDQGDVLENRLLALVALGESLEGEDGLVVGHGCEGSPAGTRGEEATDRQPRRPTSPIARRLESGSAAMLAACSLSYRRSVSRRCSSCSCWASCCSGATCPTSVAKSGARSNNSVGAWRSSRRRWTATIR